MENQQIEATPQKTALPNATAVLVLGIVSIPTCLCLGIVGLVCGIIALILAGKAMKIYKENPELFTESSLGNLKGGKICAIIGVVLSGIYLVLAIVQIIISGSILSQMPWEMMMNQSQY